MCQNMESGWAFHHPDQRCNTHGLWRVEINQNERIHVTEKTFSGILYANHSRGRCPEQSCIRFHQKLQPTNYTQLLPLMRFCNATKSRLRTPKDFPMLGQMVPNGNHNSMCFAKVCCTCASALPIRAIPAIPPRYPPIPSQEVQKLFGVPAILALLAIPAIPAIHEILANYLAA